VRCKRCGAELRTAMVEGEYGSVQVVSCCPVCTCIYCDSAKVQAADGSWFCLQCGPEARQLDDEVRDVLGCGPDIPVRPPGQECPGHEDGLCVCGDCHGPMERYDGEWYCQDCLRFDLAPIFEPAPKCPADLVGGGI
jgi:hypothetical protein